MGELLMRTRRTLTVATARGSTAVMTDDARTASVRAALCTKVEVSAT